MSRTDSAGEEHLPPHEGQEEYQEDRVDDAADYRHDRAADAADREVTANSVEESRVAEATSVEESRVAEATSVEESRVARAEELEKLAHEKSRIHRRIAFWQLAAYLLIISVSLLGWMKIEQEADARCAAGDENRQALRNIIIAIESLGTDLVTQGQNPTTPEQEATLQEFAQFRENQLALLEGSVCPDGG